MMGMTGAGEKDNGVGGSSMTEEEEPEDNCDNCSGGHHGR